MRKRTSGSVTIRSVAQAAGVSVATVSRTMAGSDKVTPERRAHVLEVADRLGYQPNVAARNLALGTTRNVGVIVPNLSNPYFYDIIRGIGRASAADGFRMMVSDSMEDADAERELTQDLLRHVDALVLAGPREAPEQMAALATAHKPVVTLIGPRPTTGIPDITVDNGGGMRSLYRHLVELGHRRIVYLSGPAGSWQNVVRLEAGLEARALGVELTVVKAGGTIEDGHQAADEAMRHDPTAITAFNDLVALGALHRLDQRGVRVPHDVSVAGFDDIVFSAYASPRLTTVRTPREELGRAGWELLRRTMEGVAPEPIDPLPAELVIRESTGSPTQTSA